MATILLLSSFVWFLAIYYCCCCFVVSVYRKMKTKRSKMKNKLLLNSIKTNKWWLNRMNFLRKEKILDDIRRKINNFRASRRYYFHFSLSVNYSNFQTINFGSAAVICASVIFNIINCLLFTVIISSFIILLALINYSWK